MAAHRCRPASLSARKIAFLAAAAAAIILIVLIKKNCPLLVEAAAESSRPLPATAARGANMPPTYGEFAAAFGRVKEEASANLARAKLFVARQLDILRHNQAFAANQSGYFLKANEFMDWTAKELRDYFDSELSAESAGPAPINLPDDEAEGGAAAPDDDELEPSKSPYNFELLLGQFKPMANFMLTQFAPPAVDLPWPREWLERKAREQRSREKATGAANPLEQLLANFNGADKSKAPAEARFELDWRKTGCVPKMKQQGECNACYAFASMDLMEFFHCRQSKRLTEFSVQYLIDCGKLPAAAGGSQGLLNGCKGGKLTAVGEFIRRRGLLPAAKLAYVARELSDTSEKSTCARQEHSPPAAESRPTLKAWHVFRDPKVWFKWALRSPLIVGINVPLDFLAYGGGVHDGATCAEGLVHAMLLVGAGRDEAGKPFWLLKNSYGPEWGESGYFRLSRSAPQKCFNLAVVGRASFAQAAAARAPH